MTPRPKRIVFSGYAPVHFLCFQPVFEELKKNDDVHVFLSGGFRKKTVNGFTYNLDGFYDQFNIDPSHIIPVSQMQNEKFDVAICSHTSDTLLPLSSCKKIQIFHGVSFKNLLVRDKALSFDVLCLPGRYHGELYRKQGLLRSSDTQYLLTGFPKTDALLKISSNREKIIRSLDLNPALPSLLFAPTGDKNNSLETMGEEVIQAIDQSGVFNLLIKPHDHPKKSIDWLEKLRPYENERIRIIQDKNIVPYLASADLLITDASSVAVEYTLLDRPILFLDVPKLLEKVKKRAPALDLETYGRKIGNIVKNPQEIVTAVINSLSEPKKDQEIRQKMSAHIFYGPGNATARVTNVIRHAAGLTPSLPDGVKVLQPVS